MNKRSLLFLHRWLAVIFSIPLALVIVTGLILSLEPWLVVRAIQHQSLTAGKVTALLDRYDPSGEARAVSYRSYDNTVTIGSGRGGTVVDVASGERLEQPSALARLLVTARRLHETLLVDAEWLVIASTVTMLLLATLGVLMGWPRLTNSLGGWHKGIAWTLLPLIVLSPLTGLLMAAGLTFNSAAGSAPSGPPLSLKQAIEVAGQDHDLSGLVFLRPQGRRLVARIAEDGEYRLYGVSASGLAPLPRNWPRLWHEGNFAGGWSSLLNVVTSLAVGALLVTGLWIWLRRQMRRWTRQNT